MAFGPKKRGSKKNYFLLTSLYDTRTLGKVQEPPPRPLTSQDHKEIGALLALEARWGEIKPSAVKRQ